MTDKKKPDRSKISLAPLTFEEALKGLLATPPPPKEPKPKRDGSKKGERERDGRSPSLSLQLLLVRSTLRGSGERTKKVHMRGFVALSGSSDPLPPSPSVFHRRISFVKLRARFVP
ncbi:MAG: hypothetical protein ACR2M3_09810 [Thermomicrobiales bacterium]